jgi:hypothetical protein
VLFLEQIRAGDCVDAFGRPSGFADSVNRRWFQSVIDAFGLSGWACLLCDDGQSEGLAVSEVLDRCEGAPLLMNISGHLDHPEVLSRAQRRVFVDIDPGFTQYWHLQGTDTRLQRHDRFFSIAENLGRPGCPIPTLGLSWSRLRQPVVLEWWPFLPGPVDGPFTTVATWRCPYGGIETAGRRYTLKLHQFRRFRDLPRRAGHPFEAALDIHPADHADAAALAAGGWEVVEAGRVASDPFAFRSYVQRSLAEFSVAQGIYVETRSGWFSDRSVRYLASGRPVLLQDTGFSDHLPVGEGLVAFDDMAGAVRGAASIRSRYEEHSEAARDLAERYFSSEVVVDDFLAQVGLE